MGLTSSSAHWLMSWASSQAAAAGLRLGRKSHSRGGHVSAPDPYSCWGLPGPGALPGPGPYPEGPGAYPRDPSCPLGSSRPVSTGVRRPSTEVRTYRCTLGSFIFPCHAVLPTLPMWWGQVLLPVRPGGVVQVQRLHTLERGYPCLKVPTVAPGPTSGEGASLQVGPKSVSCVAIA
jgi:hypothetical protein